MIELNVTLKANDGRMVSMAAQQANTIQTLNNTRKAGIASVVGYKPTTNWVESPTQNIQLITHISIENLYKRQLEALQAIEFSDVLPLCADDPVLSGEEPDKKGVVHGVKTLQAIFNESKVKKIESLEKSLRNFAGEGNAEDTDNHREAHKRCYAHFGNVKVNLKGVDGSKPKQPELDADGNVQISSIMIPYIELNVTTIVEGKRKPAANSMARVRMDRQVTRAIGKRSTVLNTLSLGADNFESFKVDGNEILTEDVVRFGDIIAA